jgi:hypothetical protein
MAVALWCADCNEPVNLDRHGNCELCGNPEVAVIDRRQPVAFLRKLIRIKKSPWLLATAVLFGVGLTIWAVRQTE